MSLLKGSLTVIIGLGGGLAVGSGFVAFVSMLEVIPRLTQLSRTHNYLRAYEWALVSGALFATTTDFFQIVFYLPRVLVILLGLLAGVFIGTLAAGLTEVLNVFPILTKRLNMETFIKTFLLAMVIGKITGSLVQFWLQLY
ncbi:stage V sporulation protein AB [Brevibacillus dissolubilis]|uniref:stage V sporulation protein AB n=1 Tax=Brevibacillus dissolubilis TaxID=1844116 RepID=UPI00111694A0|nr:stage V sporulation protein AB [Brevibacillus dissolubilis]